MVCLWGGEVWDEGARREACTLVLSYMKEEETRQRGQRWECRRACLTAIARATASNKSTRAPPAREEHHTCTAWVRADGSKAELVALARRNLDERRGLNRRKGDGKEAMLGATSRSTPKGAQRGLRGAGRAAGPLRAPIAAISTPWRRTTTCMHHHSTNFPHSGRRDIGGWCHCLIFSLSPFAKRLILSFLLVLYRVCVRL